MKKLVLVAVFALLCVSSFAQSLLWEYRPKDKSWAALAAQPIGSLTQVPVLGSLDVSAVAGVATAGRPTFGFLLSKSFALGRFDGPAGSSPVALVLGVTGRVAQGGPPTFGGLAFGVSLRF